MYKNILVPVVFDADHDTQASYRVAQALAGDGAKFTVMHVLETIPSFAAAEIPSGVMTNMRHDIEKPLLAAAKGLPDGEPLLITGHPGRSIVDYANNNAIDCIVMASHRPGFGDYFLGSTASRVVRHAKCAVHVIR